MGIASEDDLAIGPKSKQWLHKIGIHTKTDLVKMGAIPAFIAVSKNFPESKVSLNFLYGLVAIIDNVDWRDVARRDKTRLILELESYREFLSLTDQQQ